MLLHNQYSFNPDTDLIGKGGFAEVFKAFDQNLHKTVAIKRFIKDAGSKGSVIREIQNSIDYSHPNIIRYYNCFTQEYIDHLGRTITEEYGVMEYANAGSMSDIISSKRKVSDDGFKNIILGILDGLHYLHTLPTPIIHRDLKPGNILLQEQNGRLIPKICDFGISKEWQDMTKTGTTTGMVGTMEYMAPEQLAGKGIQPGTDLWALGCIIFEYFCGQPPFGKVSNGTSVPALNTNILNATYSSTQLNKIPEPFKALVKGCLVKEVDKRLKSAEDVKKILSGNKDKDTIITISKPDDNYADYLGKWIIFSLIAIAAIIGIASINHAEYDIISLYFSKKNTTYKDSVQNNVIEEVSEQVIKENNIDENEMQNIIKSLLIQDSLPSSFHKWELSNKLKFDVLWETDNIIESGKFEKEYGAYKRTGRFFPVADGQPYYKTFIDWNFDNSEDLLEKRVELSSSWRITLYGPIYGYNRIELHSELAPEMADADINSYIISKFNSKVLNTNDWDYEFEISEESCKKAYISTMKSCGASACTGYITIQL